MKKNVFFIIGLIGMSINSNAQVANFDALTFDSTGVWNGSDLSGVFEEEGFQFYNSFNPEWSSWSGFSISSQVDNTTAGWTNQYSVYNGEAHSGSNFALGTSGASISFESKVLDGFYITNSTYAALSMLQGDSFAKKFGGASGNDSDWFKLSVIGKLDAVVTDTVEFYLADYRFEDNSQDYIVSDWTWLDLNALGEVSELSFEFSSTDNGQWGMNTPAYFCMDDLKSKLVNADNLIGCTYNSAINYNVNAIQDDGSCVYDFHINQFSGHSIMLEKGWNLIGYSCSEPSGLLTDLLSSITDDIIIVKDNYGNVFLPEWGFNNIVEMSGGYGYQIKMHRQVDNFNICD